MHPWYTLVSIAALQLLLVGCERDTASAPSATAAASDVAVPHVVAASDIEAGRYLVIVGNCNDCHTENFMERDGDVPESEWLLGSGMGWRGPWGTTYPPNLRLTVQDMGEDQFVEMVHTRRALPPMPWMNLNQVSEPDARSLYRYLRSLGPAGERAPTALAPDVEPQTPYLLLVPQNLPQE